MAEAQAGKPHDRGAGRQYEGLTVWFNALIASARAARSSTSAGNVKLGPTPRRRRAKIMQQARPLAGRAARACPPTPGGPGAPGFEAGASRLRGQLPVRLRRAPQANAPKDLRRTWAGRRVSARRRRQAEPGRRSAASTSASATYSKTRTWRSRRPRASPAREPGAHAAEQGGLPPTPSTLYDDPAGQEGVPVRGPVRKSIDSARSAAGDARLRGHLAGDPGDLQPAGRRSTRTTIVDDAEGPDREGCRTGRSSDEPTAAEARHDRQAPAAQEASPTAPGPSASSPGCCARRR